MSTILTQLQVMDKRLDGIDHRLDGVDKRLDGIERRLDGVDGKLEKLDSRFFGFSMRIVNVDATDWSVAIVVLSAAIAFVVSRVSVQ